MKLCRLNDAGLEQMTAFLSTLASDAPMDCPTSILTDAATSEKLAIEIEVDRARTFRRRFEVAEYLNTMLAPLRDAPHRNLERDVGLWAWLSLLWFEQLCPPDRGGHRKPGERARWVLTTRGAGARYYRHLLYGPYIIYRSNASQPQRALALLCDPLHAVGRLYYQLTSRSSFITCPAVIEAATHLYYDTKRDRLRRGSLKIGSPGSIFRLVDILLQLDRTYDLHSIELSALLALLPDEFRSAQHRRRVA